MSNILLLAIVASRLSLAEFAIFAVLVNSLTIVQMVDLGWPALVVNLTGRAGCGLSRWEFERIRSAAGFTSVLCASLLAIGMYILLQKREFGIHGWAIAIPVGVTWCGLVAVPYLRVYSSLLIGTGRVSWYYTLAIAQPVAVLTLTPVLTGELTLTLAIGVVAATALLPGILAWAVARRIDVLRVASTGTQPTIRSWLKFRAKETASLAARQVAGVIGIYGLPIVGGVYFGARATADLAIPHRIFLTLWAVIGVYYTANWASMSRLRFTNPGEARALLRRINRLGVIAGVATGAVLVCACVALDRLRLVGSTDLVVGFLLASALLVRSSYLGTSLYAIAGATRAWLPLGQLAVAALALCIPAFVTEAALPADTGARVVAVMLLMYVCFDRVIVGVACRGPR